MTLDDLYTDIVAEELDNDTAPPRLPMLTHREAELTLALCSAVAEGEMNEDVRAIARALTTRLGMRLPAT
ncbi:hypothetical protein [Streptomyces sp. NPDC093225]|uniref:hypothetical protein n=1 Tax=Streptomyces sp. NPDC093225 TaxID=3366034 RepID=UPI00382F1F51